jgi:hypothetical protein
MISVVPMMLRGVGKVWADGCQCVAGGVCSKASDFGSWWAAVRV